MTARYEVQIVNPLDGRPKVWDLYDNRERAESIAQVRRVDADQHRDERAGAAS